MVYALYPAVDESYAFPPEVRGALAQSVELRNMVAPMTTAQRNALSGSNLWDGRIIANLDTDCLNQYRAATFTWENHITASSLSQEWSRVTGCVVTGAYAGPIESAASYIIPVTASYGPFNTSLYDITDGGLILTSSGLYQFSVSVQLIEDSGQFHVILTGVTGVQFPLHPQQGYNVELYTRPAFSGARQLQISMHSNTLGAFGSSIASVIVPDGFVPVEAALRMCVARLSA
jgi:hypothetical protein